MSRIFWFTVGAGTGVYALVKTRRAAERFTPAGLADQVAALGYGARIFGDDVRVAMAEHETELRSRLELPHPDAPARSALSPGSPADVREERVSP